MALYHTIRKWERIKTVLDALILDICIGLPIFLFPATIAVVAIVRLFKN